MTQGAAVAEGGFFSLFRPQQTRSDLLSRWRQCAPRIAVPSLQSIDCSHQFLLIVQVLATLVLDVVEAFPAGLRTGVPFPHR